MKGALVLTTLQRKWKITSNYARENTIACVFLNKESYVSQILLKAC